MAITNQKAYKCNIECKFIKDDKETPISQTLVKYLMIENLYESRYMPVIYLSMAVSNDLYSEILESSKVAKIYLRLSLENVYSRSAISKRYIEGQFTYIMANNNPNYTQVIDTESNVDRNYKQITIGLISMEIMNKMKMSYNGIFNEIDQNTLILKALQGLNATVKKPLYNPEFGTIVIPALNSKPKLISYLFDQCPFYDTNYMFFADFNKTYLIDLSGDYCDGGDGDLETVLINVNKVTVEDAYLSGLRTENGAYVIDMNPVRTNVSENTGLDKVANQQVWIGDTGKIDFVDLDVNNNADSTVKQTFHRGMNAILNKNIAESNTVIIELAKDNLFTDVITPNKKFMINNYADYADYNGDYTLLYKKEVIQNVNGEFGVSTSLGLRKVGNITSIGLGIVNAAEAMSRSMGGVGKYVSGPDGNLLPSGNGASNSTGTKTYKSNSGSKKTTAVVQKNNIVTPNIPRIKAVNDNQIKREIRKIGG